MARDGNPINTFQITDKDLARLSLGHLKGFYKYRERKGETLVQMGVKSDSGIIADGFLSFPIDDEKEFTATLEATDYWNRDELRYKHTLDLLFVDGITISFVLAVGFLGWFYFKGQISLFHLGVFSSILTLLLCILLAAGLVIVFLWPQRRYRYIYAIEQFKKYYANDQWIAYAFDVFPNYENRYYKELRRQCIRYGVGLLEIDQKKNIKVHLTPARTDAIKNNREIVEFNRISSLSRSVQKSVTSISVFQKGMNYFNWQSDLLRFRRAYYNQLAIIGTCILLICGLIFEEWQKRPINYVDEEEYVEQQNNLVEDLEQEKNSEIFYFKVDSGIFVRTKDHYIAPFIAFDVEQEPIPLTPPEKSVISVYQAGTFVDQACEDYAPITKGRYIIFFTSYYNLDEAKRNAILLRNSGVPANVAWAECFFYDRPFYLVFLESLFINQERAADQAKSLAGQLRDAGLQYEVGFSRMTR